MSSQQTGISTKHRSNNCKQSPQQHQYSNSNYGSSRQNHQSTSISFMLTLIFKKVGLQTQSWQNHNNGNGNTPQLHRLGALIGMVLTIYIASSSLLFYKHSYNTHRNGGSTLSHQQQQQQVMTPLYVTKSEHEIISKVFGIEQQQKSSFMTTTSRQKSKQCPSTMEIEVQIPPITLRKGKSQYVTEIEYQNQAVQLVHNIRMILGMATQLGQRPLTSSENITTTTSTSTDDTAATTGRLFSLFPFQRSSPEKNSKQQQIIHSLDDAVIMDYGCGPGRLLIGLLSAGICFTKYIGVEVNKKDIKWLTDTYIEKKNDESKLIMSGTQKLQQRNRNMIRDSNNNNKNSIYQVQQDEILQFIRVNVKNERYNRDGQTLNTDSIEKKERIVFPSIEIHDQLVNTVDIMILRSVFSHMLTSDIYHHLRALHPILKSNTGIMIVSLFLNTIPESPVEKVITQESQQRGNHLVYISKQIFETILYETGYTIILYLSQWNMGEDVYVLSSNGSKEPLPLFAESNDDDEGEEGEEGETQQR